MMEKKRDYGFKPLGWQGLSLQVPKSWNFVVESGSQRQGFIRLDSALSSLELKWEKMEKKKGFSIDTVADKFIEKLQKSDKNIKIQRKRASKIFGHRAFLFHFTSKFDGYGAVWCCDESDRVFLGLFTFKPEYREAKLIFENSLSAIKCHSLEDANTWSVFGFSIRLPSDFELRERKFLVGHATLAFSKEEYHFLCMEINEIFLQYWNPANIRFEQAYNSMERWFDEFYEQELKKHYKGLKKEGFRSLKINGHSVKTLSSVVKRGLFNQTISKNATYMWYCPQTNRIYALTFSKGLQKIRVVPSKKYESTLVDAFNQILASFSCH